MNERDKLILANKFFVDRNVPIVPLFKKILSTVYQSESQELLFAQVYKAVKEINDWSAAITNNHIKNIVKPGKSIVIYIYLLINNSCN